MTATDGACLLPVWSPEGDRIAHVFIPGEFDDPRHGRIAIVDRSTGGRTVLTEALDRNAAPFPAMRGPIWDAARIVFPCEDAGSMPLFEVPVDGSGPAVPCADPAGVLTGFDLVGDRLAYSASTPTSLPEVFVDGRQVTDVGSAFRAEVTLVGPEPFVAIAPDDVEVPAWIIRPPGFDADQLVPCCAQYPRRPVHAVRRPVLRRVPGGGGRRLRRALREPTRVLGLLGGAGAARSAGRSRAGPAGDRSTTTT